MPAPLFVEIHDPTCGCKGTSWMVTEEYAGRYCPDAGGTLPTDAVLVPHEEWRLLGRPKSPEKYRLALERARQQQRR